MPGHVTPSPSPGLVGRRRGPWLRPCPFSWVAEVVLGMPLSKSCPTGAVGKLRHVRGVGSYLSPRPVAPLLLPALNKSRSFPYDSVVLSECCWKVIK